MNADEVCASSYTNESRTRADGARQKAERQRGTEQSQPIKVRRQSLEEDKGDWHRDSKRTYNQERQRGETKEDSATVVKSSPMDHLSSSAFHSSRCLTIVCGGTCKRNANIQRTRLWNEQSRIGLGKRERGKEKKKKEIEKRDKSFIFLIFY